MHQKDFTSDQEVRWCPGCGDYAILSAVQKVLPELGVAPHNTVFVSGIGCSGRFPYYVETYGFHGIHGRAPAIATGLKLARPDLSVWVVTGDGDALSIGGNHFIHALRRNVDFNVLMFNNRIYGLTKGQYSPTSEVGKKTGSTPFGSLDHPFNPASVALGAGSTFVARCVDVDIKTLQRIVAAAALHKGTSFIEIFQNCNVFNDGAWRQLTDKETKEDALLFLEHGKPMIFGKERNKGIRWSGTHAEVVTVGEHGVTENDLLVHDAHNPNPVIHFALSLFEPPAFPVPVGVLRDVERGTYDDALWRQIASAREKLGEGDLGKLLHAGEIWTVS
ncbi:MAG: 2-oxoacid:ferredoxin oxidoreductase subunit beta [Deltaproteobacteria bacterium]|nr:2-oxoacid:ferredoxin oxidoreductase subunit beta [Deltaproteobacteria bacterium]